MALDPTDPSNPSGDYSAMIDDWTMIADIRAGARAVKARDGGKTYLPRFSKESETAYTIRLKSAPWRPEFTDALRNLCSKPFTKEVSLQGEKNSAVKDFAEDVDGQGNNLHCFARDTFVNAVAMGLDAIYVTFPDAEPAKTQAEEKASGVRPYWVHIAAENIIALYTKPVGGRTIVQHIRIREVGVEQLGFAEVAFDRIRVIELDDGGKPVWQLWEKQKNKDTGVEKYVLIKEGVITLNEIPIVLFFTGQVKSHYCVKPPLADLAVMQMEIYRALSRQDQILTYAGFPMLVGRGLNPPQPTPQMMPDGTIVDIPAAQIEVGPSTVLFAPPAMDGVQPDWAFIQPAAANIAAIDTNIDNLVDSFRRLALQPLSANSGRLTATQAAIDAAKAHTAIEVWANALKDVLEQAFTYTCEWMKISETVEVSVHTDFGVDIEGVDEFANLITMNGKGKLSDDTLWQEGQRRGIFGPQFDPDKEPAKIASDQQGLDVNGTSEPQTDPVTGKPIDNSTLPAS